MLLDEYWQYHSTVIGIFFVSDSKIQAVQLAVHGNKLAVHLHCFATM